MSRFEAPPGIITNGLVLNLDAGDPDSYTRSQPSYVEVLVVAGGGTGGTSSPSNGGGAGGGAGGVIYNSAYQINSAAAITVTVGAGGAGQTVDTSQGNDGSNSVFGSLTAVGGGGGGSASGGTTTGRNGGSGGGAGYVGYYNNFNSGTGTTGQGFRGGYVLANNNAGGGGGAGGVGGDTFDSRPEPGYPAGNGGLGGPGVYYSISGTSTLYSNGGNGGSNAANTIVNGSGTTGTYGGSGDTDTGGSGIVIVRYPGLPAATGGTITYLNGYTIHTFTTSGTFTPFLWNDVSGNGYSSTLTNGVEFTSYQNGGVLSFDGTDDFGLGSISASTFSGASTIGCWFYRRSITEWAGLFSNNVGTTSCNLLTFIYNTNVIGINQAGISGAYVGIDLGADHLNKWIYCVLVLTGSTNGSVVNVYAYKDGNLLTSTGNLYWSLTTHNQYYVGRHWTGGTQILNGNIPVVQVYNRALSAAEITQNFNAQKNRFGL
jgi:hypothetical protein